MMNYNSFMVGGTTSSLSTVTSAAKARLQAQTTSRTVRKEVEMKQRVTSAAGGGSFSGEYARIIKQMNVIDQGSFFFFYFMGSKESAEAECTSHNALRIKQTMKKPKIDKP